MATATWTLRTNSGSTPLSVRRSARPRTLPTSITTATGELAPRTARSSACGSAGRSRYGSETKVCSGGTLGPAPALTNHVPEDCLRSSEIVPAPQASHRRGQGRGPDMGRPFLTLGVGIGLAAAGMAGLYFGSAYFSPPRREQPTMASWDEGLVRFPFDDGPRQEHRQTSSEIQTVLRRVEVKQATADA